MIDSNYPTGPYCTFHHYFPVEEKPKIKTTQEFHSAIRLGKYEDALEYIEFTDREFVGEPDKNGQTALHWAAVSGSEELIHALLEKMDNDQISYETRTIKETALHFAARYRNTLFFHKICAYPIFKGLANKVDALNQTSLYIAAERFAPLELCQKLISVMDKENIALKTTSSKLKETTLHAAARTKNLGLVKLLVEEKNLPEEFIATKDSGGQTALHLAAGHGAFEIFQLLYPLSVSAKCVEWQTENNKYTVLHLGIHANNSRIVEFVVDKFNVGDEFLGSVDKHGQTALHWAAGKGNFEASKALYDKMSVEQICTQMAIGSREQTALHFAVQGNYLKIVKLLLERPDVKHKLIKIKDINHSTALDWAKDKDQGITEALKSKS